MAADRKAPGRGIGRMNAAQRAVVLMNINRCAKASIGLNGQNRDAAPEIIRNEDILSCRVDAEVSRTGSMRANHVQRTQIAIRPVDGKCADGPAISLIVRYFVDRVEVPSGRVERQP